MKITHLKIFLPMLVCCSLMLLTACGREDRNNPGYSYFTDMAQSVPYEFYSENPNFADGITAQLPVRGAIPRGFVPYPYSKTMDEQKKAGLELVNPIPNTHEEVIRGKEKFEMYCMMCHGKKGEGNGYLVTTKKITKEVTSLVKEYVQKKPDGEIFHVITLGAVSGLMGSYSWQLKPDDRWRIIRYIKSDLKNK